MFYAPGYFPDERRNEPERGCRDRGCRDGPPGDPLGEATGPKATGPKATGPKATGRAAGLLFGRGAGTSLAVVAFVKVRAGVAAALAATETMAGTTPGTVAGSATLAGHLAKGYIAETVLGKVKLGGLGFADSFHEVGTVLGHGIFHLCTGLEIGIEQGLDLGIGLAGIDSLAESLLLKPESTEAFTLFLLSLIVNGPEDLGLFCGEGELLGDVSHFFGFEALVIRTLMIFFLGHCAKGNCQREQYGNNLFHLSSSLPEGPGNRPQSSEKK